MGMKKIDSNILALGEATGHSHRVNGGTIFMDDNEQMMLDAPEGSTITHEEHKTLTIPPGQYDRSLVQELDPFEQEIRSVLD